MQINNKSSVQKLICKLYKNNLFAYGLDLIKILIANIQQSFDVTVNSRMIGLETKASANINNENKLSGDLKLIRRANAVVDTSSEISFPMELKTMLHSNVNTTSSLSADITRCVPMKAEILSADIISFSNNPHLSIPILSQLAAIESISINTPITTTYLRSDIIDCEDIIILKDKYLNEIDEHAIDDYDEHSIEVLDGDNMKLYVQLHADIDIGNHIAVEIT